jgi:hypothetical protein
MNDNRPDATQRPILRSKNGFMPETFAFDSQMLVDG